MHQWESLTILQNAKQELNEQGWIHWLGRSLSWSVLPSLGRRLLFVFLLTNAQLDLRRQKMLSYGSANEKQWNNNEIDFSYVKGLGCASIFLFWALSLRLFRWASSFATGNLKIPIPFNCLHNPHPRTEQLTPDITVESSSQ